MKPDTDGAPAREFTTVRLFKSDARDLAALAGLTGVTAAAAYKAAVGERVRKALARATTSRLKSKEQKP